MKPGPDDLSWVVFLRSLDFIPLWEVGESSAVCCSNPYSVVLTERGFPFLNERNPYIRPELGFIPNPRTSE